MKKPPTKRQMDVLRVIRDYQRRHGYGPARVDIAKALNLKAPQGIDSHINGLERRGLLISTGKARGLRLVEPDQVPLIDARDEVGPKEALIDESRIIDRISGSVADLFDPRPTLFWRSDDSLRTLCINAGELVAIATGLEAQDGQIVVARIGNRFTCRRLQRIDESLVELAPITSDGKDAPVQIDSVVEHVYIEGVVVGTLVAKALNP